MTERDSGAGAATLMPCGGNRIRRLRKSKVCLFAASTDVDVDLILTVVIDTGFFVIYFSREGVGSVVQGGWGALRAPKAKLADHPLSRMKTIACMIVANRYFVYSWFR